MADATLYSTIATHILRGQFSVVGPLAVDQAKLVSGIAIDTANNVKITGNGKEVLANLVKQFETLFGNASVEVCKDAIKESSTAISPKDLPEILL
jgi:hypothetical protein